MQRLLKIKTINGYRCFSPLVWDENDAELFDKYNLIYGWNGSGKSTLGSFFHQLEKKALMPAGITFEMSFRDDAGRTIPFVTEQYANMHHRFLVFHDSYIEENIKKYDEIDRIFIIGDDQGERVAKLGILREEIKQAENSLGELQATYGSKKTAYEEYCRTHAAQIKREAGLSAAFNKNAFIEACRGEVKEVSEAQYKDAKNALTTEKRSELSLFTPPSVDNQRMNRLISDLEATPTNQAIKELQQDAKLAEWVGTGLAFHKSAGERCKFCGSTISSKRMEELAGHFNQSYQKLMNDLEREKEFFSRYIDSMEEYKRSFPAMEALYPEFRDTYLQACEQMKAKIDEQISIIKRLIRIIQRKETDVIHTIYADEAREQLCLCVNLQGAYEIIYGIVGSHNQRCKSNEEYIQNARETICDYWIESFRQEWRQYETEYTTFGIKCEKDREKLQRMKDEADKIERQIRDSRIPAEKINRDIAFLMGRNEIRFEEYENGYKIMRNGCRVEHLSKGEENAVALIYFFNALEGDAIDRKEAIVILDDPISSFDSNFYFNAISYIKSKIEDVGQVFILTHKYSLLNDYKNMFRNTSMKLYLMDRRSGCPVIRKLDSHLQEYYDEYAYLFKQIYLFVQNPPKDVSKYLIYPNIARRVLESYLMFKVPRTEGTIIQKAMELAKRDNDPSIHAILRLTNDRSHLRIIPNSEYSDSTDELTSMPEILKLLLVFMRNNDPYHFDTLVKTFDETYDGEESFSRSILKEGVEPKWIIKLFDFAVCAGDGFNPSDDQFAYEDFETDNSDADYALRISGHSMEEKIPDGSIVLVKIVEELSNKDTGVFIWEGECMCKKYIVNNSKILLVPNNRKYERIAVDHPENLVIQGKVIDVIMPDA